MQDALIPNIRVDNVPLDLEPIPAAADRPFGLLSPDDECHSVCAVHTDFVNYWTGIGAERIKDIETETRSKLKFVNSDLFLGAFVALTGTDSARLYAEKVLTKEYLRLRIGTTDATGSEVDQSVERECQVPTQSFHNAFGRFGRNIGAYMQKYACSIAVNLDLIQNDQWTVVIEGPKDDVEAIQADLRQRSQKVDAKLSIFTPLKAKPEQEEEEQRIYKHGSVLEDESEVGLPTRMRQIMRLMPHSVVLITATASGVPNHRPDDRQNIDPKTCCAMTVSSMNTVSLTPDPYISFNIKKPSRTLDAIAAKNNFHVNLLASTPQGARLADAFAYGNAEAGFNKIRDLGAQIGLVPNLSTYVPAVLSQGVIGYLACRSVRQRWMAVGDHVIVVAKVKNLILGPQASSEHGLAYADGRYRQLGEPHSADEVASVTFEDTDLFAQALEKLGGEQQMASGEKSPKVHFYDVPQRSFRKVRSSAAAPETDVQDVNNSDTLRVGEDSTSRPQQSMDTAEEDDFETGLPGGARYRFSEADVESIQNDWVVTEREAFEKQDDEKILERVNSEGNEAAQTPRKAD
ncbi:MAG: hypothetical protein M1822_007473 [Bathelium mastoideum]|nr:MAG: hypothetical protein M1822_007473 [Bathelium mastoideum]